MGIPVIAEAVSIVLSNPLLAYVLLIFILVADASASGLVNFSGVIGFIVNTVIASLFGVDLQITSFQILVIVAITPVLLFVLSKSRQLQKR